MIGVSRLFAVIFTVYVLIIAVSVAFITQISVYTFLRFSKSEK